MSVNFYVVYKWKIFKNSKSRMFQQVLLVRLVNFIQRNGIERTQGPFIVGTEQVVDWCYCRLICQPLPDNRWGVIARHRRWLVVKSEVFGEEFANIGPIAVPQQLRHHP